jgi:hypothetical protein
MSLNKLLLFVTMLIVGVSAHAQTCATTAGVTTCTYSIPDDGYAIVPIPFGFPFYGRIFTHSLFFDNGLVSFYSPTDPMRTGGQNFNAQPLSNNTGSNFYYSIMPMWSDLVNYSGSHTTETDGAGFLRYNWNDISQWGFPERLNTFSLEIQPSGFIGINYQKINIDGYPITAGMVGDASLGEWHQQYHKPSFGAANITSINNWSFSETYGADCSNPLNNANCPGYAEALFQQQCSSNALYSPACPGYTEALLTQQCSINTLYSPSCPGYAVAYLDYQCSLNALYSTTCIGYSEAYFDQQCGLDPLYNEQCLGYDDAFYVQQCNLDPLYDSGCDGFAEAYALNNIQNAEPNVIETNIEQPITQILEVEQTTNTSSISAVDVSSPVQLIAQTPTEVNTNVTSTSTSSSATTPSAPSASQNQNQPRTTRQALAQARLEAQRAQAAEQGKAAAEKMDSATSLEDQVAVQNVVLQAMGFNAAFDAYSKTFVPDGEMYKPFTIYDNQKNVDNQRLVRGLTAGSDRLHMEMVDEQYR